MKKRTILLATVAFLLPLMAEPLQADQQKNKPLDFSSRENDVTYKDAAHLFPFSSSEPVSQSQKTNKGTAEKIVMRIVVPTVIGYLSMKFMSKAIHLFQSWRANPNPDPDNGRPDKRTRVRKHHRPWSESSSHSSVSLGLDSSGSGLSLPMSASAFSLEEEVNRRGAMRPAAIATSVAIDPVQVLVDAIVQPGNIHTPQGALTIYVRLLKETQDESLIARAFRKIYGKENWAGRINEAKDKYAKHDKKRL